MKRRIPVFMLMCVLLMSACIRETYDNTPLGNFDRLWTLMDEHYCYFDYKAKEYGLDWNKVYQKYRPLVTDTIGDEALFNLCADMLSELRDGHVNIYSVYDVGRNWSWMEKYPPNYYKHIQDNYLDTDYKIGGGFRYTILNDSIGYIYYGDFSSSASDAYINRIIEYFMNCKGIIFDVRNNGGGLVPNVETIISHFTDKEVLCGYLRHKTGPGHSDFSDYEEMRVSPAKGYIWLRPVAVLTNRSCFSATNTFVSEISTLEQVRVFGDRTGGGGGIPLSFELPNGWSVRYSSSPMYDLDYKDIEFGVEPDVRVGIYDVDMQHGIDSIIETAIDWLSNYDKNNKQE